MQPQNFSSGKDQFGHADIPPAKQEQVEITPANKISSQPISGTLFGASEPSDPFGHADIPLAKHLIAQKEINNPKQKVTFNENLNMHENSSASSLEDGEELPVKAQPFLFGEKDDMSEMKFPSDGHLQNQINI